MYKQFDQIYHFIDEFKEADLSKLDSKITLIYRNYKEKIDTLLVEKIKQFCKKTNRKFYLANDIKDEIEEEREFFGGEEQLVEIDKKTYKEMCKILEGNKIPFMGIA